MGERESLINRRTASSDLQGHEIADPDWRNASQDIKDGLGNMLPAARTRANATYYGFIVLSIGLIVMIIILMHESRQWRETVKAEGELWRGIILALLLESNLWRGTLLSEVLLWRHTVHEVLRIIGFE